MTKKQLIEAKYEVGVDEGENGTRTIAFFCNKKEAESFVYFYGLQHPDEKLFIDTCTYDYLNEVN